MRTDYIERAEYREPQNALVKVVPSLDGPIPEITDEERDLVCTQIDRLGLWSTDVPLMLGLVDR